MEMLNNKERTFNSILRQSFDKTGDKFAMF